MPKGWKILAGEGQVTIAARTEGVVRFRAVAPTDARGGRHMMGLAITADGRSFGELAEAMVDLPE